MDNLDDNLDDNLISISGEYIFNPPYSCGADYSESSDYNTWSEEDEDECDAIRSFELQEEENSKKFVIDALRVPCGMTLKCSGGRAVRTHLLCLHCKK